ncbi:hypothetical protein K461DRAFT_9200 [Myriangium duriaei CBS 260.36]|uniref:Uncharacterized protein n=1 Tax=Myriangium duriaei CBS 260.36 TaxID=1168546 RepID=A0A9P4JDH5_9PEZI|nr:hypothetical protein K461DRAFT_9200 [Myriangium duriaei CBS 260.36]
MFALPDAKRVRRSDLHSPSSSRASSPAASAIELFNSQIKLDYVVTDSAPAEPSQPDNSNDEDEVAFNLFARPAGNNAAPATKIQLRSPSPVEGEGGVLRLGRPDAYYFRGALTEELRAEYDDAAMYGEEVRRLARMVCPGLAYKWKVTLLSAGREKVDATAARVEEREMRRTRPGKKTRIKRRQVAVKKKEKVAEEQEAKAVKERADREKKAKRNREKKFKKRARDKAKKQTAGEHGPTDEAMGSPSKDEDDA